MTHTILQLPPPPAALDGEELKTKLDRCRAVLESKGKKGILFHQEGAMRWLTGHRNQIVDIRPGDPCPVQALLEPGDGKWKITFITDAIEMVRVRDQFPEIYEGAEGVSTGFSIQAPRLTEDVSKPGDPDYQEITGDIVRPLAGGFKGSQYRKFLWLARATAALLAHTARQLEPGMNGSQVKALLSWNFLNAGVESNLFLVALAGQEHHLHPLYHERYRVEKNGWIKLVAGARFADMINSATVMVKMGNPLEDEVRWHRALQDAVVEYADCYRSGAVEGAIYGMVRRRFAAVGKAHGLDGFEESAYLHHLGGPTSPLGNRDYIIQKNGERRMFPWMQFAVNPVECRHATKAELQGIVMPEGPPHIPDVFTFVPAGAMTHRVCRAEGGTECGIADIIAR